VARRRILQLSDAGLLSVASESTFESEERLHSAIAEHPEVLPSEDVGLGPLVTVANELDLGHGPMDTLAVDSTGRLAIIEFKRGSENPDVRKVVAQVLDYGSALWRISYDNLEAASRLAPPGFDGALVDHVCTRLARLGVATFDADAFRRGVESGLDSGEFVFLYVARDLDDRTKRIMTYLAEGPRMTFFAVEVDYYRGSDAGAVLVPRVAFVPSWITDPQRGTPPRPELLLEEAPQPVREIARRMETVVERLGILETRARASLIYRPARRAPGMTVYLDGSKVEFDLDSFHRRGADSFADDFLDRLERIAGKPIHRGTYPGVPPSVLIDQWAGAESEIIEHYFRGRLAHIEEEGEPSALDVGRLHDLLRRLPEGRWTTYGDLAAAMGSHARAVGGHIGNCPACENAWRVLQVGGSVSSGFRWTDPNKHDDPRQVLEKEGVRFVGDRAQEDDRLSLAELTALS
jgi:alkylated DNA nucleotide flippase Atl1